MVSTCRPEKAARFVFRDWSSMRPRKCARYGRFELSSAADLKFLQWLPRIRNRNFKSKAALDLKFAYPLCSPKFV
jgi:hypothetical protein